ncbi:T9SS C-terminal target domain-containing protein [Rhodohalobacter sp. SW132]|uniref:YCF48-related protein n=1 Tax=Rhodohalobacter sp. SW132 TaxID=2293433 RepID=UPI000E22CA9D|nr:YCF48-related protein [Rhodohalobacter sp. SW132]REL38484.1 T9SS C-terminal target domain-containing protein [Rhodohalobacter sp. SW132]
MDQTKAIIPALFFSLLMLIAAGLPVAEAQFIQHGNPLTEDTGWTGDFGFGTDGQINDLAEGPDGELYVGGNFDHAGALEAGNIALWTGEEWQNIGDLNGTVAALYTHEDVLYVGGSFTEINPADGSAFSALGIAQYNTSSGQWSTMGAGFTLGGVTTLEMNNSGTLYAGGCFSQSGGESFNGISAWTGNEWVPFTVGSEDYEYTGLWGGCVSAIYYDEVSNSLYVGGGFRNARIYDSDYESFDGYRDTPVGGIVRWSGGNWHMVGGGTWRRAGAVENVSTGFVQTITRHPDSGRLYIGGSFDHLIEEELMDMADIDQNNATHATSFAYRENGSWHGFETTSLSTRKNPLNSQGRATLRHMFIDGEHIYIFGNVVTLGTQNQGSFTVGGVAVFNDTNMEYELDSEGYSILGNGAWHRSARTVPGSRPTRVGLKMGDDIFIAGEFNAFHRGTTTGTLLDMENITRFDGETFHQLGFGIDGGGVTALAMADGLLYLGVGGNFRRAYAGSKTYDASLAIAYDPEARDFVPLQGGISRSGVGTPGAQIHTIIEDPDTGDIYFGGNFIYGINEDGLTEATRSLIRWDGTQWQEVQNLTGGTAMWNPMVNDLHIKNGQLYIAGYFSTIPDRADHQLNLMQLDLTSGESASIDFPEEWALRDRNFISLESDDEHLYITANIYNVNDNETGTLFRKNLETGAVSQLNGRLRGNSANSSNETMMRDGEFLYIAGGFLNFRQWDEDGQLIQRDSPRTLMIVHPETDTWFYPPEAVKPPGNRIRDIYKSGNTIYYANQTSDEDRGIRLDIGTGQAHQVGDGLNGNPRAFARQGDDLWVGGSFSQRLARTTIVDSDPAPVAMAQLSTANAFTRSGEEETIYLYVANIGDADLTWDVTVSYTDEHGFGLPDGLVVPDLGNGSVEPATAGVIPLQLEGGSNTTGTYRVEVEVTTNDASEPFLLELDVTINSLFTATNPEPAPDTVDVDVNTTLQWSGDENADEITVYFGTHPELGADEIIYQGAPVAALDSTYYSGPLDWYTEYYWMVTKSNEISDSQSPVWSFRTMDNPVHGTWTLVESDVIEGNFFKTHFNSPQVGWILGYSQIFRTTDGGESFDEVVPADEDPQYEWQRYYQDIYFSDDQTGWIISRYEGIFRTEDGGDTWDRIADGTDHSINSAWFHGPDTGWLAGNSGEIRRTGDGGETWEELGSGTDESLNEIRFADNQTGWAVGDEGTIIRTTDGGDTWQEQNSGTDHDLEGLAVHDAQTAWAAGEDEIILFTDDGGTTWSTQHLAEDISFRTPDLETVFAIDRDTVWAVGGRSSQVALTMFSTDGGLTWARVPVPTERSIMDAHFTSAQSGWAVANNGTLLKYTGPEGESETPVSVHPDEPSELVTDLELDQNYPNPFNPTTQIRFSLPEQSNVRLDIYNMLGQRVAVLVNEGKSSGRHTVRFDASGLSSGVYFYRLQTDSQTLARQMMLIK